MSTSSDSSQAKPNTNGKRAPRRRVSSPAATVISNAEPALWFTGAGLVLCIAMIVGLLGFVLYNGATTFWPGPVVRIETHDGSVIMGEIARDDYYSPAEEMLERLPAPSLELAREELQRRNGQAHRRLVRIGNYELTGEHFRWVSDYLIKAEGESRPEWAMVLEREAWGRFYGTPKSIKVGGEIAATEPASIWKLFQEHHAEVRHRWERRRALEKKDIGKVNHSMEKERLALRSVELAKGKDSPEYAKAQSEFLEREKGFQDRFASLRAEIKTINDENAKYSIVLTTADGKEAELRLDDIVRATVPNRSGFMVKLGVYTSRWGEFLGSEPREANSEGGVWPAIFGTVMMTLIMALVVAPFGVLAALYLREYAKPGKLVSSVRIAINNLAGVPSIVFGVFGLGFFSYIIGANIDQLFFAEKLPSPTYGTGGILWASLTLALLTLPVVIVATEEALSAVPNSMREGSYACGASKWQTIQRIVLPRAMPGVMTGMILAMARGAGEVAPLMLVGAVKLAPELPIDGHFPFFHLERSFMHLGFHIYDLGFQSQNSEAAKPMVFTTTLLLILVILILNTIGIVVRARLKRRFATSAV